MTRSAFVLLSWAALAVPLSGCGDEPKRVDGPVDPTCEVGDLVPCRCDEQTVGRAQCGATGESISACDCRPNTVQAGFTNCSMGDRVDCPCPASPGFTMCDLTGVYKVCMCTTPMQGTGGVMQGTGGVMQGTGGVMQGTGGVMQGTGGFMQGTGGVMQGTGGFMQGSSGMGGGF